MGTEVAPEAAGSYLGTVKRVLSEKGASPEKGGLKDVARVTYKASSKPGLPL